MPDGLDILRSLVESVIDKDLNGGVDGNRTHDAFMTGRRVSGASRFDGRNGKKQIEPPASR